MNNRDRNDRDRFENRNRTSQFGDDTSPSRQSSQWDDQASYQDDDVWTGQRDTHAGTGRTDRGATRSSAQSPTRDAAARANYGYMNREDGDRGYYDRGGFRDDYRETGHAQRDGAYTGGSYGGQRYSNFAGGDYGRDDYASGGLRQPARFGGAQYGGSTFDDGRASSYYGRSSNSNPARDYDDWRRHGEDRGFLERAGDEIASWFGDENAARRREQDHAGRGPKDYVRSDDRIREDINDRLTHDRRVDASSISVAVSNCEVTLTGTVSDRSAKRRAEDIADHVSGVRHVQNNLRVATGSDAAASSGWNSPTSAISPATPVTGAKSDTAR